MSEDIKEIREKLDDVVNNVSKLWGAFRELAVDYWGPDKTNGLRSRVVEVTEQVNELDQSCRHYFDAERRYTCYGVKALEEYKKAIQKEKDDRDRALAEEIKDQEVVEVAKINANSATTVQVLTLIGVIVGPLLVKLAEHFFK